MPGTLSSENGSVMLLTLMFIVILTVMGLVATQTSIFEIKIAENARRYSEEFAGAEAALNVAIANFRHLKDPGGETTDDIAKVLNDTMNSDYKNAVYINESSQIFPGDENENKIALIEIRRILKPKSGEALDCSDNGTDKDCDICGLSEQASHVPKLSHRYYAGSIDKRRFAITATAYGRHPKIRDGKRIPSTTWVQKGISLPAGQDKDIF